MVSTIVYKKFLGVNNRLPRTELKAEAGNYLADAINVDIDFGGKIRTRPGLSRVIALSGAHSIHMVNDQYGFVAAEGKIYKVSVSDYSLHEVCAVSGAAPISWVDFSGWTFYSNGTDSGKISAAGVRQPMALPTPSAPLLAPAVGNLPAGRYLVCVGYSSEDGHCGSVSMTSAIDIQDGRGVSVQLPGLVDGASHVNVYLSHPNGSVPFFAQTVSASAQNVTLSSIGTGAEPFQEFAAPLPPGQLFVHGGALCSFDGSVLYEGIPYWPGYYLPAEGSIPFPDEISNCLPTNNGLYVVADAVYWISGLSVTKTESIIQTLLPYGGVKGTGFYSPNKSLVGWFGGKGVVIASSSGEVNAVMADSISLTPPLSGWSSVIENDGYRRVISCGWCVNLDNFAATRYEGFSANSMSRGVCAASDGIYLFSERNPVKHFVDFGDENFSSEYEKLMPVAYIGAASDDFLTLRVSSQRLGEFDYQAEAYGEKLDIRRFDPGKGLRDNYFGLSIIGTGRFEMDSISFGPINSPRRR